MLISTDIPIDVLPVGSMLARIHWPKHEQLFFGPAAGQRPTYRFDDPNSEFKVCYLSLTPEGAFAETFLRDPPVRLLSHRDLSARNLAMVEVVKPIRILTAYGAGLARIGVTSALLSGPYSAAREFARSVWEGGRGVEGIRYPSRHDDEQHCIALFDRASASIRTIGTECLTADSHRLGSILERYALALE